MKYPNKKCKNWYQSGLIVVICGIAGLAVAAQAIASVPDAHDGRLPSKVLTLAAPSTPTPTPKATPVVTPIATLAPTKSVRRVASAPKVLPAIAPAPNSAVSQLVAVAPATPSPAANSTPTPGPGTGGATASQPTVYTSDNWAGYMSPAGNFSAISGSWTVPNVRGNGFSTSADAAWIGIGGVTSSDLIQVGTDGTVSRNGQVTTTAFYEMLPAAETTVPNMTVNVGDAMTADIHVTGGSQWAITITDVTLNETFSTTVTYTSSQSTAEWIEEDPSFASGGLIPFDNFGLINFTSALATSAGTSENLNSSGAQKIILENSRGRVLAQPSDIGSDGESFSVSN